jgi:hypothetical protein
VLSLLGSRRNVERDRLDSYKSLHRLVFDIHPQGYFRFYRNAAVMAASPPAGQNILLNGLFQKRVSQRIG